MAFSENAGKDLAIWKIRVAQFNNWNGPSFSFLVFDTEVTEKFGNYLIDFYSLLEIGFPPAIRFLFTAYIAFSNHQRFQRFICTYGTWSLLEFSCIST